LGSPYTSYWLLFNFEVLKTSLYCKSHKIRKITLE
jgi:hypothetical protein